MGPGPALLSRPAREARRRGNPGAQAETGGPELRALVRHPAERGVLRRPLRQERRSAGAGVRPRLPAGRDPGQPSCLDAGVGLLTSSAPSPLRPALSRSAGPTAIRMASAPAEDVARGRRERRRRLDARRSKCRIRLGGRMERWCRLKERLGFALHSQLAKFLLDRSEGRREGAGLRRREGREATRGGAGPGRPGLGDLGTSPGLCPLQVLVLRLHLLRRSVVDGAGVEGAEGWSWG